MNGSQDYDPLNMKNAIIYFTGTGNSLAIARLLAARLPQATIISVNEMLRQSLFKLDTDACGFVFPVYCKDAPEIVKRLVRLVQLPTNAYVFAIATHNGAPGYSHFTINKILKKKGQRLKAGFAVLMPGNSITPYDSTNSKEEEQRRLQAAEYCVDQISDDVAKRATLPYAGSASLQNRIKGFRNMLRYKVLFKVPEKFWVTDLCNHCGLCAQICPENNIRVDSASVIWGKHCQMCLACIHWCPKHAIQNGEVTLQRKRYHHPDISIDDMICRDREINL
jgi:formate hydrogenlyase subunit 6/NADH:ubiquinone oxidoreductase subunit I/flavodoxin